MPQEKIFTSNQIDILLNAEFIKFEKKWHGVTNMGDLQTLAKFIAQVMVTINEPVTNPC